MDFYLDIGALTETIDEYQRLIQLLSQEEVNLNNAVDKLRSQGWSGKACDEFINKHNEKMGEYHEFQEAINKLKTAIEDDEKPKAVLLKNRCEDFAALVGKGGVSTPSTDSNSGIISLEFGKVPQINDIVSQCTCTLNNMMKTKFDEIDNLKDQLEYTSFGISIDDCNQELWNQTVHLTSFNESLNEYNVGVQDMESNIVSKLGQISGLSEKISSIGDDLIVSEDGKINETELVKILLKDEAKLTDSEKEQLEFIRNLLGEDKVEEIKEKIETKLKEAQEMDEQIGAENNKLDNILDFFFDKINPLGANPVSTIKKIDEFIGNSDFLKNVLGEKGYNFVENILHTETKLISNPVEAFNDINKEIADTDFGKWLNGDSKAAKGLKMLSIRGEALTSDAINFGKGILELGDMSKNSSESIIERFGIHINRYLGTNGMDNDTKYERALEINNQKLSSMKDALLGIPGGIIKDVKNTFDLDKAGDFFTNPDMSLNDAADWSNSAINTALIIDGGIKGVKGLKAKFTTSEVAESGEIGELSNSIEKSFNESEIVESEIKSAVEDIKAIDTKLESEIESTMKSSVVKDSIKPETDITIKNIDSISDIKENVMKAESVEKAREIKVKENIDTEVGKHIDDVEAVKKNISEKEILQNEQKKVAGDGNVVVDPEIDVLKKSKDVKVGEKEVTTEDAKVNEQRDKEVGKPEIGKKLEYVFGNATGNKHNIERSLDMENKLNKIGIFDNTKGRSFMENELKKAFNDTTNGIIQENGRIRKESLLIGPNGIAKMESVWDGDRLITVEIFNSDWKSFVK